MPTLSEQALSYLHFTSDVNWNASSDLQALYAQLVSLSVLHLVQISGETGLEGAMDLVGVEAAIDRMAAQDAGAFTANTEGDNGTGDEEGNGGAGEEGNRSASGEECGALSFTPTTTVSTAHGKQAIGTMQVGEQVWAYNPRTKKMELESVLHV